MRAQLIAALACLGALAAAPAVTVLKCPDGGIQPQAAVDARGRLHLIYLKGDDAQSDIYYMRSDDGARSWSESIRVNSAPGAAIAVGSVRGPHLAIGGGGRFVHVAWMGSGGAQPRGPRDSTPMLYSRLAEGQRTFEAQRNLITAHAGLDGGGSVAADEEGNVYVAWHAPGADAAKKGEAGRVLYVAQSTDDGEHFKPEREEMPRPTGVCGCCGMRAAIDGRGGLMLLYRAANQRTRDIYLIHEQGARLLSQWPIRTCPMSTAAFARREGLSVVAFESQRQVWLQSTTDSQPVSPPGEGDNRKHPSPAIAGDGSVLLAWSEGTAWKQGGSVAWQVFDSALKPVAGAGAGRKGLAAWSVPAAVAIGDRFVVFY